MGDGRVKDRTNSYHIIRQRRTYSDDAGDICTGDPSNIKTILQRSPAPPINSGERLQQPCALHQIALNGLQANSLGDALVVVLDGLVAEHGEDVDGAEGGREDGDHAHEDGVLFAVVVDRVVGGEGDQRAEADRQRVEHLCRRVHPNGRVGQLLHLCGHTHVRREKAMSQAVAINERTVLNRLKRFRLFEVSISQYRLNKAHSEQQLFVAILSLLRCKRK